MRVRSERRKRAAPMIQFARFVLDGSAAQMMDGGTTAQASHATPLVSTQPELGMWSTDMVKERERFCYWREAVTSKVYGISIDAAAESFSAWITGRTSGPFRFAMSESTGYTIVRSRREIENGPSDHRSVYLQLSGQT